MIKFFRKIRQRLLSENKFSKYLLYAIGEIALVVIGILIALQINNWNENQKIRVKEIEILEDLQESFQTDLADIQLNISLYKSCKESIHIILDYFQNNKPFSDTLSHHFAQAAAPVRFVSDDSSYETLKILGPSIISNVTLRKEIINIHDFSYENIKTWENAGMFVGHDIRTNQFLKHFDKIEGWILGENGDWVPGKMTPRNYNSLSKNQDFIATLKTILTSTEALGLIGYNSIERRLKEVIDKINDEIKKLNDE